MPQMKDLVPAEVCVHISQGKARDQVLEVLDHFNVCVTEKDIFSRCQVRQHSYAYTSAYVGMPERKIHYLGLLIVVI